MVSALANVITRYPGPANRVRCLAHIINLVVQVILRRFDIPKKKKKDRRHQDDDTESNGEEVLTDLENEEREMDTGDGEDDATSDVEDVEGAMNEELEEAVEHVKPVQKVLFKVSVFPFAHAYCLIYAAMVPPFQRLPFKWLRHSHRLQNSYLPHIILPRCRLSR